MDREAREYQQIAGEEEAGEEEEFMRRDREFFEAHPEATDYVREVMPGEFGGEAVRLDAKVHVVQIASGTRARIPVPDAAYLGQLAASEGLSLKAFVMEIALFSGGEEEQ